MIVLYVFFLFLLGCCSFSYAQQPYLGNAVTDCSYTNDSALGYSCNGVNTTCQAYLIFRSQPPYNDVSSISKLLGSDPFQLSDINLVSVDATFERDRLVISPVTCSCSGQFYQKNHTYVVQSQDTPYIIAYNIYQGLSTCSAIVDQNRKNGTENIFPGQRKNIPLRCACPTKYQADSGIKYLLSYPVAGGDVISLISARFDVDPATTLEANGLTFQNTKIIPLTTVLVPLQVPPDSSQIAGPSPPSNSSPPSPLSTFHGKTWIYVIVGIVGGILVLVSCGIIFVALVRRCNTNIDPVNVSDGGPQAQLLRNYEFLFDELQSATNNFSPSYLEGSFYRGNFKGNVVAIKKLDEDATEGIKLFDELKHDNLIHLLGYCLHDRIYYLVYEYAANGSLSSRNYYSKNSELFLDWKQRVQIAWDVAKGLNYLHRLTKPRAHRNINSSSIFLDSDLQAKIGNLPITRSEEGDQETFFKDDIHDFGCLMLEIITGNRVAELQTQENLNLSDILSNAVAEEVGHDRLKQIIDRSMEGNYPPEQARFMVRLINSCLNESPAARPSMDEVERDLSRIFSNSMMELSSNISAYQSSSISISERRV